MTQEKSVIYFSHGNGFPSLSYNKMLNHLSNQYQYDVYVMNKIGHDSHYPITDNWAELVNELIADIERQTDVPVIAVGHSMGGVLSYMASIKRPDLFRAVITLDSIFVRKLRLMMLRLAKWVGLIEWVTPAKRTKNRRNYWENRAAVEKYLHNNPFFKSLDPDCLNDYMVHGIKEDEDGFHLVFNREREYQIYCTIPHLFALFNQQKRDIPSVLIYGQQTQVLKPSDIRAARKLYHMRCLPMPGTHMFPMQYPLETANKIHEVILELNDIVI